VIAITPEQVCAAIQWGWCDAHRRFSPYYAASYWHDIAERLYGIQRLVHALDVGSQEDFRAQVALIGDLDLLQAIAGEHEETAINRRETRREHEEPPL
jgi:hypothetical protein